MPSRAHRCVGHERRFGAMKNVFAALNGDSFLGGVGIAGPGGDSGYRTASSPPLVRTTQSDMEPPSNFGGVFYFQVRRPLPQRTTRLPLSDHLSVPMFPNPRGELSRLELQLRLQMRGCWAGRARGGTAAGTWCCLRSCRPGIVNA
jgi:hypothetical protein